MATERRAVPRVAAARPGPAAPRHHRPHDVPGGAYPRVPEVDELGNVVVRDMVKELAFTAYPCADVAATRAWYERHLGLTFMGPYVEDGMEKYNEAHIGSGCFSLMWNGWMDAAAGTGNGVA